jgi:hypothetical protein
MKYLLFWILCFSMLIGSFNKKELDDFTNWGFWAKTGTVIVKNRTQIFPK